MARIYEARVALSEISCSTARRFAVEARYSSSAECFAGDNDQLHSQVVARVQVI